MTQVLIDRATLEQAVDAIESLTSLVRDEYTQAEEDTLSALRKSLAGAEPTGWQPIETAPKGEIIVLCLPPFKGYRTDDRRVYEGRWHEPQATWTGVNGFLLLGEATHWMPLPTPPKEQP